MANLELKVIESIFEQVVNVSPDKREDNLKALCAGNQELETEVRLLLEADSKSRDLFDRVALPDDALPNDNDLSLSMRSPREFGPYRLLEKIGAGGMGVVFRAEDTRLKRDVALKFLSPQFSSNEQARNRFMVEAQAVGKLDHPNVCLIHDVGVTPEKQLYFAMPYYKGDTLKEALVNRPVTMQQAIDYSLQICYGVEAAHKQNIIHRDIKPANVLITHEGVIKLLDFGIAKTDELDLTLSKQALGTVSYMAPEQLTGDNIDVRVDIWSIGVIFYELMTTHRPFRGKTYFDIASAISRCEPAPLSHCFFSVPALADRIIEKTLNLKRDTRYRNVAQLIEDLKKLQQHTALQEAPTLDSAQHLDQGQSNPDEQHLSEPLNTSGISHSSVTQDTSNSVFQAGMLPEKSKTKTPFYIAIMLVLAVFLGIGVVSTTGFGKPVLNQIAYLFGGIEHTRGVNNDRILLGMSGALSGSIRETGRAMQVGMLARFQEINEQGGIHGRFIELKAMDDRYEPDRALANITTLLDPNEGVFALIGNIGTPTAEAILPEVLRQKTVLFGTISGAASLRQIPPDRYIFNYRPSYAEETAALVNYFIEQGINADNIGVLYQNDSYGFAGLSGVEHSVKQGLKHGLKGYDRQRELIKASYPRNTTQVDSAVKHFLAHPDELKAVIVIGSYLASTRFTKEMKDGGYHGLFGNVSVVGTRRLAEEFMELGGHYGEGVIISQVVPYYDSYATGVMNYRSALEKYFPNDHPGSASLEGYIVATIFAEALIRTGRMLTTEAFINTLYTINALDLGIGPNISFSPSKHQASHYVWGARLTADGDVERFTLTDD